jgi:hypothetical protein
MSAMWMSDAGATLESFYSSEILCNTRSSAMVKERAGLYLYPMSVPSWQVTG